MTPTRPATLRSRPARHRSSLAIVVALVAGVALPSTACGDGTETSSDAPPPVVLVVLDTLRADWHSFRGYERDTMPYLARLAAESAVFEKAYSTSSWTAPSTSSLLTGTYPDRHGVQRGFMHQLREATEGAQGPVETEDLHLLRISSTTETLPEFFQRNGYATFGLATNLNIGPEIGFDRGFPPDRFERHDEWSAGMVYERLMEWKPEIQAADSFFVYLHLNDVHKPYDLRKKWYEENEDVPEARLYQSEMGYLDAWLERMLVDLELPDDAIVAIVSDHGEEFLEHGGMGHHLSLFGEVNEIVFLLNGPGVRAGRYEHEVSGIDLAPTLVQLAGFAPQVERQDGVSLAPLIVDGASDAVVAHTRSRLDGRPIFASRVGRDLSLHAVVRDGWKLMKTDDAVWLYDLENDPGEESNVVLERKDKYQELKELFDEFEQRSFEVDSAETEVKFDPELKAKLAELGYVRD